MRALIALFATAVLSLVLVIQYPDAMIRPGRLSEGHRNLNNDCMRCHVPARGARPEKCASCHRPDQIGRQKVDGTPVAASRSAKTSFHSQLADADCAGCHTVHLSERPRRSPATFRHEFLAPSAGGACASCHSDAKPTDSLHERAGAQCAACHGTQSWLPAAFDHSRIDSSQGGCASCHQKQTPGDGLHRQAAGDCRECHGTWSWRPATFDHVRYFRFDRNHPSNCSNCHTTPGTFTAYSCYGCHEHSPGRIAAKHREEGINNFEGCARCHRGGGEAEGESEDESEGESEDH